MFCSWCKDCADRMNLSIIMSDIYIIVYFIEADENTNNLISDGFVIRRGVGWFFCNVRHHRSQGSRVIELLLNVNFTKICILFTVYFHTLIQCTN